MSGQLNNLSLQLRIPFDLELKGTEGKEFLGFSGSWNTGYKPEGEQYAKEELLYCKAFKGTAKFINQYFKKGSDITIEGEIRRDDDYTDGEGNPQKGQMYILVKDAHFATSRKSDGSNSDTQAAAPKSNASKTPAAKTGAKAPAAGTKKKLPF
jgi:single-strand DNA-binding protein